MATINLGAIKFNWKGAYNNSTAYAVDDVVSSSGNSYVCIQASQGNAVGNATAYWNIMSSAGAAGAEGGSTTLTTRGDVLYRGASAVARLAKGTEGQVLGQGANDPAWVNGSAKTLTTQGDLLYRDGSGLQRLAKGSAAQTLAMNSAANAPEWVTASSGGYWSKVAGGTATGDANINFTSLPADKVLRLIISGKFANPNIYFSADNGSNYRTTDEYAFTGYQLRTDETYSDSYHFRDSTANGLLHVAGWFGAASYGGGLDITFYNMSSSSRASSCFAWSGGSHQRSNPETSIGWLASALNTRETNNAMRLSTNSGDTNIDYILLSGDQS